MQLYTNSLTAYSRLKTKEVKIGALLLGNGHPIRVQTMTTTDTMDTMGTVEQTIRCIEAGAEMVRITAPSKKEAENLAAIKAELKKRGYNVPLIADIHFTPNAAEVAARIVEKVRVNPGNYVDKKRFDIIEYTDDAYAAEIERIRERFTPLVKICKEYGTAMRIGTNHGSLSDRIMSRYGDTPIGMVESAMEFLRIARDENYHNIVLSMKSSNPQVMVQAYRLLVEKMYQEFKEAYPLHLGVTEAGDGEDGRIKSAVGIGTLLEDGLGDTIRVSLTEDPELEIPVCHDIIRKYSNVEQEGDNNLQNMLPPIQQLPYSPFQYHRRKTNAIDLIGGAQVPVVIADFTNAKLQDPDELKAIGYHYDAATDKWSIGDMAADYILTGNQVPDFALPGTLKVIVDAPVWQNNISNNSCLPLFELEDYAAASHKHATINFIHVKYTHAAILGDLTQLNSDPTAVLLLEATNQFAMTTIRRMVVEMIQQGVKAPVIIVSNSPAANPDDHLIHFAVETGALLLDGMGDGICLKVTATNAPAQGQQDVKVSGRNYQETSSQAQFINNTAFSILQATRTRVSKTEYISCPSCGRTLFDLQETTAKIRAVTNHLKGVKIAIMGCIVNGPGEMADADFGYVGSGPGKITLYKGKEVVKRNVPSGIAVEELINLLKDNGAWVELANPGKM